mmetsp:Transcript_40921/g.73970  ORF Transcript_40921/g.73970 Transcript_40921/m.73970 type:complete len:107 (-) Transcript_40921:1158-1478(-)
MTPMPTLKSGLAKAWLSVHSEMRSGGENMLTAMMRMYPGSVSYGIKLFTLMAAFLHPFMTVKDAGKVRRKAWAVHQNPPTLTINKVAMRAPSAITDIAEANWHTTV